jgi:Spy/CpxP family protein refolding chaperone
MYRKRVLSMALCAAVASTTIVTEQNAALAAGSVAQAFYNDHLGIFRGILLSPTQLQSATAAAADEMTAIAPLQKQLSAIRSQIADALGGSGSLDTAQLSALQEEVGQLEGQIALTRLNFIVEVRALLTPDQVADAAQRHTDAVALRAQEKALHDEPSNSLASLPRDVYGDGLGFTRGVSLTAAQVAQASAILGASASAVRGLRSQERAIRGQITAQLTGSGAVTLAQLTPLQQQASAIDDQIYAQRLAMTMQLRSLLTPAQLAHAAQLHQQLAALRAQERVLLAQSGSAN